MGYLDEEIVAIHFEIVELQRSPFARRQGDVMEQLSVSVLFSLTNLSQNETLLPARFISSTYRLLNQLLRRFQWK